jgi:hypothetical protein
MSIVNTVDLNRAEELLDGLRPRSDYFRNSVERRFEQYVFRGHEDDRFELVPSALRFGKSMKSRLGSWGKAVPNPENKRLEKFVEHRTGMAAPLSWENKHQVAAEALMLVEFFQFADAAGLPLPEDSQTLRERLERVLIYIKELKDDEGNIEWPSSQILSEFRALYALESGHGNKPKFTRRVTKICHIWKPFTQKRVQCPTNDVDILLRIFLASW